MEIIQSMVTENPCYKAAKKIQVKGLMLHSVGCPQPSAEVFVKNFNNADAKVCVHGFIDANNGKVYQTLPWEHRGWHCGGSANNTHIGVEMCEPSCIRYTGGANIVCCNEEQAKEAVRRTLKSAVELFCILCKQYHLNPMAEGTIISHKEGHDKGLASGHADPDHLFTQLNMNYTMDDFRKEVAAAINRASEPIAPKQPIAPPPMKQPTMPPPPMPNQPIAPPPMKQPTMPPPPMPTNQMSISDAGVELIARYEGCRFEAYKCPAGVWTIGYGHTAGVKEGDRISGPEQAKAMLKEDLKIYGGYVNDCVKRGLITFPLTQNQFDALTSFCYNCGAGNLHKLVTGRDAATVAETMLLYNKGGGKILTGLVKRREEERKLFLS